ncbi:hypothetical protein CFC21_087395, partial [Triticum aestivum]
MPTGTRVCRTQCRRQLLSSMP